MFYCLIFFSLSLFANIVHIESGDNYNGQHIWKTQIDLSLKGERGRSLRDDIDGSLRLDYYDNLRHVFGIFSYGRGQREDETYKKEYFIHGRFIYKLFTSFAIETFYQKGYDEFDSLLSRRLLGGGVRYFLKKGGVAGSGLIYEQEEQQDFLEANHWRLNTYFSQKFFLRHRISVITTIYIQPILSNFSEVKLFASTKLLFEMTQWWASTFLIEGGYDSSPSAEVDKSFLEYKLGFQLTF